MTVDLMGVFQVGRIIETTVDQFNICIPRRLYSQIYGAAIYVKYIQLEDKQLGLWEITKQKKNSV